ncbi:hypothetical protein FSARC_9800 [Fusarium sarcochroum]|uniref:Uncharacterized protein n=1 Tax=Fusarium sarcochroum TaxID=1208366 RepID=A0A8H4TQN2_9HYPO|nr:hypothetical protein FSARC_9800 [Fusarium sarcochroum]
MSDDASPSSTAPNDASPAEPANASSGSRVTWDLPREQSRSTRSRAQSQSQRRKKKKSRKKRNPGLARKLEFVTHLLKSLDTLVFAELRQKPPTSRVYYCLADVLILAVQCLMLTVHTERERLRLTLKTFRPMVPEVAQEMAPTIEDLDAEERGVSRDMPGSLPANEEADGIELQPLRRGSTADEANSTSGESELSIRDPLIDEPTRSHLSDVLSSGNAVIGEYHVLHSLRNAAMNLERTAAYSLRTISYGATMASIEARRRGLNVPARTTQNDRQ